MKTLTLSILQFNTFVKNILDAEEFLSNISVFGEVTNFKISGGNAYFDLKDENAMLSCVKFGAEDISIKNGDRVTVFGKVNFYIKSGRLNFIVSKTQAYGLGDLYQKFLELKNRLEQEGFFREDIKKSIPKYSKRIGVVTSEHGAVIRDIINVTKKKNPFTEIVVYPSKVQGVSAENEIVAGIKYFNTRNDIDVIIIARGGGSLEDLAPFNTEKIVQGIYESSLPIISAVGHETDFTLCDFASDLRVPTPSVAAEVAVFDYLKEVSRIKEISERIGQVVFDKLDNSKELLVNQTELISKNMKISLSEIKQALLSNIKNIEMAIGIKLSKTKSELDKIIEIIKKLNPLEVLRNGYALVEYENKKLLSIKDVNVWDQLKISISDGSILAEVKNKGDNLWHLSSHLVNWKK